MKDFKHLDEQIMHLKQNKKIIFDCDMDAQKTVRIH